LGSRGFSGEGLHILTFAVEARVPAAEVQLCVAAADGNGDAVSGAAFEYTSRGGSRKERATSDASGGVTFASQIASGSTRRALAQRVAAGQEFVKGKQVPWH